MIKHIVALILLAAGVFLFFNSDDKEVKTHQKTAQPAEPVTHQKILAESKKEEEPKQVVSVSKEKHKVPKNVTHEERTVISPTETKTKPKRKLVGGAEVDFIENLYPEEKPTKFGFPPM